MWQPSLKTNDCNKTRACCCPPLCPPFCLFVCLSLLLLLIVCLHQRVKQSSGYRDRRTRDRQRRHRRAERDARRHDDDDALDRVTHGVLQVGRENGNGRTCVRRRAGVGRATSACVQTSGQSGERSKTRGCIVKPLSWVTKHICRGLHADEVSAVDSPLKYSGRVKSQRGTYGRHPKQETKPYLNARMIF